MIERISRARVAPIDRDDVPASLMALLTHAMKRNPDHRQQSVLELVRDLQRVEAELGLTTTQADVAMDDWARATAGDPGDRTIVRVVAPRTVGSAADRRRRRRRAVASTSFADSAPELPPAGTVARRRTRLIAAVLVFVSLAVIALGATATLLAIQGGDRELPRVTNVEAQLDGSTIVFSWRNPGLAASDTYQVRLSDGTEAFQRSGEFAVAASPGERVCVTVRVVREGRLGSASDEKCVEATGT